MPFFANNWINLDLKKSADTLIVHKRDNNTHFYANNWIHADIKGRRKSQKKEPIERIIVNKHMKSDYFMDMVTIEKHLKSAYSKDSSIGKHKKSSYLNEFVHKI